jgi:hypothetical protein
MSMSRAWVPILVALMAVGCATPVPSATPQPGSTATATPLATIDERDLVSGQLTCGQGDTFSAAALQGPGGAEFGDDPAAAGLRAVLEERADPELPRLGWHRVLASDAHVQFVARGVGAQAWHVVALMNGASGWTMDVAGACRLAVLLGPAMGAASWWVDPARGVPAPSAMAIDALVQERACASGRAPDGRVAAPVVVYQPDAILVVFGVVPLPGGQDCPGAPPARYRIALTEPLGQRRLLDGGVIPPRDATRPPN